MDLPGLIVNLMPGQRYNLAQIIEDMVFKHASVENKIILCVCQATEDPATNIAIALAKRADKDGRRTLGVITKIDRSG
ncbi:hypothetical protein WJX73_009651 [Symbiochloris irregularis]|uniref:Dynamin-type G domain-containing protein n=1 Tax=Symbiochloris irregularis TaxID=706552 RepID=A0AAW1NW68_9CHLO